MITFLESVALAYTERYDDLSEFCFIFPSKRAGAFFLNKLRHTIGNRTMLAPEITTIAELVEKLSGRIVDSHIDLLFLLYKCYCRLTGHNPADPQQSGVDFDSFRVWGEIALSDFNEIDMYGVDADEIFKNLKDFREIASNYLTEEQKRVMEEYLGYAPGVEREEKSFWKTFEPVSDLTEAKQRFLHLWQVMAPLYHQLNLELENLGMTTMGGAYRLTRDRLDSDSGSELPWKKMVFVGFNALSFMEREIFSLLRGLPGRLAIDGDDSSYADFLWDGTGRILGPEGTSSSASHFLKLNRRDFPSPQWIEPFISRADSDGLPQRIRVIASPSYSSQARIAGGCLEEWRRDLSPDYFAEARVAVVMPDENLLLPMLYSLPEGMTEVNLTMGYPIRLTSTCSFVALYRRLQLHVRRTPEGYAFFRRDLTQILGHPFCHAVLGSDKIRKINSRLNESRRHSTVPSSLADISPELCELLQPLPPKSDFYHAAANLQHTLEIVDTALANRRGASVIKTTLDRDHIAIYLDAVRRLLSAIEEHGIALPAFSFLVLADRLLAGEQVNFEGEPLQGLQIMGMLETRALDFDRIIIPSANEKLLPRRGRTRTFIPNALRAAYHIPPAEHQENLAAYYFYRLISRAQEVIMIYDARSGGGKKSDEVSRYVQQLNHLYAPGRLEFEECRFKIDPQQNPLKEIRKIPAISSMLLPYLDGDSKKRLSATVLSTYCSCGLKFFYERLAGIRTDNEVSEYIDAKTQGDVVHEVIMSLYLPEEKRKKLLSHPVEMSREYLENILKNKSRIKRLVARSINSHHYHLPADKLDTPLPGAAMLVAPHLEKWIAGIVSHDLKLAPFSILGCEFGSEVRYPFGDEGKMVNMRYVIDRMDRITLPDGTKRTRIVDYKTGSSINLAVESLDFAELASDYQKRAALQLLLYAELFSYHEKEAGHEVADLDPVIYHVPDMTPEALSKKHAPEVRISLEGEEITSSAGVADLFRGNLKACLAEIFNSSTPFRSPANEASACKFCTLSSLCGR